MYNLRVLVNGSPIKVYNDQAGRKWVEARYGTKFSLKIENSSYNRILAIPSVDGLNSINAKHQDPEKSPGYIINSNSSIKIPGWLISDNEAREFVFTTRSNSYAKKIGADTSNVGVLAAAIFMEKPYITYTYGNTWEPSYNKRWYDNDWYTTTAVCDSDGCITTQGMNDSTPHIFNVSSCVNESSGDVSVGSGEATDFSTTNSYFDRGELITTITIYYDTRDNLIAKGIIKDDGLPKPFPVDSGYCPDV